MYLLCGTRYKSKKLRKKDDILLMCSDGLTNMVEESKIYEVVRENKEKAPEILVNLANNAGGYDNITVITII